MTPAVKRPAHTARTALFRCDRCALTSAQPAHTLEVLHRCPTTKTLRALRRLPPEPSHP